MSEKFQENEKPRKEENDRKSELQFTIHEFKNATEIIIVGEKSARERKLQIRRGHNHTSQTDSPGSYRN